MANMTKPMPTIGVDKYTYCPMALDANGVEQDTAAGIKYGVARTLPGTVEIAINDAFDAENFDADNMAYIVDTYIDTMGHDITNADIPPEADAAWRGLTIAENGDPFVMIGQPKTVYFAVMWRILKANGKHRYVKYFKGTYTFASNLGGTTKPSTGVSDKQTAQATFNAVQTVYEGSSADGDTTGRYAYSYIDEEDVPIGSEQGSYASIAAFETAWFSDPLTMTNIPAITP